MDRKFIGSRSASAAMEQSFWLSRTVDAHASTPVQEGAIPEPRHSVRRSVNLEVLVNHGFAYSTPWHVRDFSLTGVFVEMNAGALPLGSDVEVVVRFRYQGRPIEHRLPATVTRTEGKGMALTFGQYDDQAYTDIANLLYAS